MVGRRRTAAKKKDDLSDSWFGLDGNDVDGNVEAEALAIIARGTQIAHQTQTTSCTGSACSKRPAKAKDSKAGKSQSTKRDKDCSCASCVLRSSGAAIDKWANSDAKQHIYEKLLHSKDHKYWKDSAAVVYDDNKPLFHLYKYENFRNNVRALKKSILSEQERLSFDEDAVKRESKAFPRDRLTQHGNPYYDTSETRKILAQMAKAGTLDEYKGRPSALRASNAVFEEFSAHDFAKRVNREKQKANEVVGWQHHRKIKGMKKHIAKYESRKATTEK